MQSSIRESVHATMKRGVGKAKGLVEQYEERNTNRQSTLQKTGVGGRNHCTPKLRSICLALLL